VTEPENRPVLRAADADREQAVATLRHAVVEGRLTLEEFGDRVGAAYESRTELELARLVEDLPARTAGGGTPVVEQKALFSHLVRNGPLRLPARTAFRSLFGTIDLDLRQATLEASEVEIAVHNVFGTVTVLVPEGTDVQVEGGTGLFASLRLDTTTSVPTAGGPVIHIRATRIAGTLNVRTREPKRLVQRLLGAEG
jgi:hypothetical protein